MIHPDPALEAFQELALNYETTVNQELQKAWGVSYAGFVEQILQFSGMQGDIRVLDIATGTGLIPRTLASSLGPNAAIVGLDITYLALQIGRAKILSTPEEMPISFTCATAIAMPFAPGSFDWVICALATHHIGQAELISQVSRVLKPGGQFILADVMASPSWQFPGIKLLLRLAAFLYFFFKQSPARAWIESQAVSYVHTPQEWTTALRKNAFSRIRECKPSIQRTWAPSAMMLAATKDAL